MEEYIVKVYSDKTKWYNKANQLHRLDGPAREWRDGAKAWYQNGKLHRLDGPARELSNGFKEWWIEGVEYTKKEFIKVTQPATELTVAEIAKRLGINNLKIVKG